MAKTKPQSQFHTKRQTSTYDTIVSYTLTHNFSVSKLRVGLFVIVSHWWWWIVQMRTISTDNRNFNSTVRIKYNSERKSESMCRTLQITEILKGIKSWIRQKTNWATENKQQQQEEEGKKQETTKSRFWKKFIKRQNRIAFAFVASGFGGLFMSMWHLPADDMCAPRFDRISVICVSVAERWNWIWIWTFDSIRMHWYAIHNKPRMNPSSFVDNY